MNRSLLGVGALIVGSVALVGAPAEPAAADDTPWTLPVRPPRCTTAEAESGDVADCLLYFYRDPADDGWGAPPTPGVGDGWEWNGYTYSGSPALAEWEAERITANTQPLAGKRAGYFETHVAAQVLFEGFVREITDRGYDIRHASAYSFRCTAGSGGWSCPQGDVRGLSLHAWGLAIDMNSDKNPIKRYSGVDGATACATPIATDMPQWVIQTAEKWGLYWGGYGWSSGCIDTTTWRTSVYRDPPHFEFRGTPEMARSIAAHNLGEGFAGDCFTVVGDDGDDEQRCTSSGRPEAGWRIPVEVPGAPEGTRAAMVNLAVTGATSRGHVTVEDCAPRSGARDTAALTFAADQTVATMAVVPIDDEGRFCVYSNASVHRIVDVVAHLVDPATDPPPTTTTDPDVTLPPGDAAGTTTTTTMTEPTSTTTTTEPTSTTTTTEPTGTTTTEPSTPNAGKSTDVLWFEPVTPTRLIDTRDGAGRVADGSELHVDPVADVVRLANLAATESFERGHLRAGGCGELGPASGFSSLNYPAATTRSNLVFVAGNSDGTCVFALHATHVIVDELGRFTSEPGLGWDLTAGGRLLDTRECTDIWCDGRPGAATVMRIPVDSPASAIVVAITSTESDDRGYLWAGPCSVLDGRTIPPTSNLNHAAGETTTNLAVVGLEGGEFCLFNRTRGHVIVDIQASLSDDARIGVAPVTPTRIHDTRDRTTSTTSTTSTSTTSTTTTTTTTTGDG